MGAKFFKKKPKKFKRDPKTLEPVQQPTERKPKAAKKPRKKKDPFYNSYEWKKLRYEILKRDNYVCALCGKGRNDYYEDGITKVKLSVDHIIKRSEDHSKELDPENCRILCFNCHEALSGIQNQEESFEEIGNVYDDSDNANQDQLIRYVFGTNC